MKKLIGIFLFAVVSTSGLVWSEGGKIRSAPYVQDVGSVSTGTITAVQVTTTPALAYSTGTMKAGVSLSTTATFGEFMPDRINLTFVNQTTTDVWVGFTPNVSTMPADNGLYNMFVASVGYRLVPNQIWNIPGSIKDYWVVASTTTNRNFIAIQQK